MNDLISFLEDPDPCHLVFLAMLLAAIGGSMVNRSQALCRAGLRIGAGVLVMYVARGLVTSWPPNAADLIPVVLRALVVAALAVGASWIALATSAAILAGLGYLKRASTVRFSQLQQGQYSRERDEEERLRRETMERTRGEEERRKYLRAQQEARLRAEAREHRADARALVARVYAKYRHAVEKRLPSDVLADYVAKHLAEDHDPEKVDARARDLVATIESLALEAEPPKKRSTPADLAAWYQAERAQIEALDAADPMRNIQLVELNMRYAELTQQRMEDYRP